MARIKREMLREAVRQNKSIVPGGAEAPKAKPSRRLLSWKGFLRAAFLVVIPVLVLLSIDALSSRPPSPPEVVVVDRGQAPPETGPGATLRAPRRIAPSVFRLAIKTVVLDAGHGGHDPGARTPAGLLEKDVTLDVARRLSAILAEEQIEVKMTRDTDRFVSLRDRATFANEARADLFVSIHVNAIPMGVRRGVETYYLGATDDPELSRLASEENQTSGYSLADFKTLLEGVYADVKLEESRRLAQAVQGALFRSLKKHSPGLSDRGVKQAPFVVLVASEMPGILAEVSSVSSEDEARYLQDPAYRESIAKALHAGIRAYAEEKSRPAFAPDAKASAGSRGI